MMSSSTQAKPASQEKTLSDQEILRLEDEFVETYLKTQLHPYRTLARLYLRYWKELLLSLFFYLVKSSPDLLLPLITANIINLVVARPVDMLARLTYNIIFIVVLLLMNIPTHMLHTKYQSIVMRRVEAGLRGAMVRKLQQLSISFHKEMQSGRIQSKLMRDVESVQTLSSQLFTLIPGVIIRMLSALIIVITKNLTVFTFFVLCIPFSVLLMRAFRANIRKYNTQFRKNMESTSADLMEMVEMTQITRAHALENFEIRKLTNRLATVAQTGYRLDIVQAGFGASTWVTFQIFQLACLVFSAFLAFRGSIEVGDISLYQSYFGSLTGQVSTLIGLMPIITKGMDSVASIGEILGAHDIEDNRGKKELDQLSGRYEFRDVRFHYKSDQPVLQGLDLTVQPGETIAIVGESGSGKSTILNLVLGFNKPDEGTFLIDGTNVEDINLQSYRRHLSVVPQTTVLFTGTIRDNITYGMSTVSEQQLEQVIEAANLINPKNLFPIHYFEIDWKKLAAGLNPGICMYVDGVHCAK